LKRAPSGVRSDAAASAAWARAKQVVPNFLRHARESVAAPESVLINNLVKVAGTQRNGRAELDPIELVV